MPKNLTTWFMDAPFVYARHALIHRRKGHLIIFSSLISFTNAIIKPEAILKINKNLASSRPLRTFLLRFNTSFIQKGYTFFFTLSANNYGRFHRKTREKTIFHRSIIRVGVFEIYFC